MMNDVRKSIDDICGYALMLDLVQFKEELKNDKRAKTAEHTEPVEYFLTD